MPIYNKSKAKWINYSPVGSNAWYSLPHIGNEVDVYFPNTDAVGAIVISTSRVGHDGENTMRNPKDKVLATKWGAKLSLSRSSIELSNSFTEIKLGDNIEISSNDSLTIESLNEINIGKTIRTTRDSDGNKVSVVKETKSINIEAEEMVSFVVLKKSGAIEVDDEVIFTSLEDTVAEGLEKRPNPIIEIENEVWEPEVIAPVEEVKEEKKGGFWSKLGKVLLVAAVAVAVVAVIVVAGPLAIGALASAASGVSLAAVATGALIGGGISVAVTAAMDYADNGKFDSGAGEYLKQFAIGAATGALGGGLGSISKLSRVVRLGIEGGFDSTINVLEQLSSNNWNLSKLNWGETVFAGVAGICIGESASKIFKHISAPLSKVAKSANKILKSAMKSADNIVRTASESAEKIVKTAIASADKMVKSTVDIAGEIVYIARKSADQIIKAASDSADKMVQSVRYAMESMDDVAKATIDSAEKFAKSAIKSVKGITESAVASAKQIADNMLLKLASERGSTTVESLLPGLSIVEKFFAKNADEVVEGAVKNLDDGAGAVLKNVDEVVEGMSKANLPNLNIATKKLQKKFKHAIDFGVEGNYNPSNAKLFSEAITNHIDDAATATYKSTYRGQDVFVHMKKGLGVLTDTSGEFISGWKFTQEQIEFHFKNGIKLK